MTNSFGVAFLSIAIFLFTGHFARSQSVRPTHGGALFADESTLSQQVDFVLSVLPPVLKGWGLELIPESLTIDSERDHRGEYFKRYYYQGPQQTLTYFPYIARTIRFLVRDRKQPAILKEGSTYLVEFLQTGQKSSPDFNASTLRVTQELRKKNKLVFALSESYEPNSLINDLNLDSLHLQSAGHSFFVLASSTVKLSYLNKELKGLLSARGYRIVPMSLNIDFYSDYAFTYRFKDRYAQMVTGLIENAANERRNFNLLLWENNSSHHLKLRPEACNSSYANSVSALNPNQKVQFVLSQTYTNEDLRNELDLTIILQRSLAYPK